jgi:hypothetical protein
MPTQHNTQAAHPLNGVRAVAFDCYGTLLRLTNRSSSHRLLLDRLNLSAQQRAQAARLIMMQRVQFRDVPAWFGYSRPPEDFDALDRSAIHSSVGVLRNLRELTNHQKPRVPQ